MRDPADHFLPDESQGLWRQQVQLARGYWRREEAGGAVRSAGWWESVTVTWAPPPASGRRRAMLQRAAAAAADVLVPVLTDVAVASASRLLDRRQPAHPVASSLRRQVASAARALPRARKALEGRGPSQA